MQEEAATPLRITTVRIAACLVICLASQWLAFQLTIQPENISIFWPPAGVMLGCLLCANRRSWITLATLFLLATALANSLAGRGPSVNAALSLTDVAIALLGALSYRAHAAPETLLESRKNLWLLLLVAGMSAMLSATVGAAMVSITFDATYWSLWRLWVTSVLLGIVLTTPALLAWSDATPPRMPARPWFSPGVIAVLVLAAASFAYLSQFIAATAGGALIYVPMPLLVWIALHGSGRETTLAIFVTAIIAIGSAVHGRIFGDLSTTEALWRNLHLQTDLTVLATTTLFLVAMAAERRRLAARDRDHAAALLESETRFRTLVQLSPDAVLVVAQGRILYANPAAATLLGADRSEAMLDQPIDRINHPDCRAVIAERTRLILSENRVAPLTDLKWLRLDGSTIDVEVTASLISWHGQPAIQAIARDISAKKIAESELIERNRLIQTILETTTAAVVTSDERGLILTANSRAEQIFGYTNAELHGTNISVLMSPDQSGFHDDFLRRYRQTGQAVIIGATRIVTARRKDGSIFPVEISIGETLQRGRRIFTGFLRDLTARQEAQRRIDALQAELAQVARRTAMGEFAAVLAHELNQPLAALTNYAAAANEMAKQGKAIDPGVAQIIEKITQQATRAREVLRRMRRLVEQRELECTPEDPHEVIAEAIELALIGRRDPPIAIDYTPALGMPAIAIDRIQVQQVLINLIRNAADAMRDSPRRLLTIDATLHVESEIEIRVRDTGHGIPDALAPRIFEPFVSTTEGGMGIGLSLSRSIIEAHGGRLWFEGATGGGTVFHLTLPLAEPKRPGGQ